MMAASHKNLPNLIGIGIVLHLCYIVGNCFKKNDDDALFGCRNNDDPRKF